MPLLRENQLLKERICFLRAVLERLRRMGKQIPVGYPHCKNLKEHRDVSVGTLLSQFRDLRKWPSGVPTEGC